MSSLRPDTSVVRDPDMIAAQMDGDIVMMSVERGEYFGIGGVGTRVWELLETPGTVDELCGAICEEYDVDETVCRTDITAFVDHLLGLGLLKAV